MLRQATLVRAPHDEGTYALLEGLVGPDSSSPGSSISDPGCLGSHEKRRAGRTKASTRHGGFKFRLARADATIVSTDGAEVTRDSTHLNDSLSVGVATPRAEIGQRPPLTLLAPPEFITAPDPKSASSPDVPEPNNPRDAWPERGTASSAVLSKLYINTASLLFASGAAVLLVFGPLSQYHPVHRVASPLLTFVLLSVVFSATLSSLVSFHYRGSTYHFGLLEVPLLLGLVFASPLVLVLSLLAGELVVVGLIRRRAITKLLFSVASSTFAAAVASAVFRGLLGSHSPVSPWGWGASTAALALGSVIAAEAYRLFMWLEGHKAHSEFVTEALLLAASIGLAFVVLDAAWWDLWATVPLILVGALIVFAYRGYTRLSLRFGALQRLYDFSRSLGSANLEPSGMTWAVLEQVRAVMRTRRAELILAETSGIPRRVSFDPVVGPKIEPLVLDNSSLVSEVMSTKESVLRSRQRGTTVTVATDSVLGEYREAVVAPLLDGETIIGVLVAIDREEEEDSFDAEDLHLFEALAVHASSSLDRARLVEELRFEVDSKSHQATHDSLTGLPNRTLFLSRAAVALSESDGVAIALLDLDRFKDVNDTLGHAIGDRLLCEVAERVVHSISGRATVARLGGDEFALVLPDVGGSEEAVAIVHELNRELAKPIEIDGLTFAVTASVGVAIAPQHGDNVALLLQRADIAMYLAKERRSGIELYSAGHDQSMQRRLMLGGLLVHALETGNELSLMYQPIADLSTGQVEAGRGTGAVEQSCARLDSNARIHRDRRTDGDHWSDNGLRPKGSLHEARRVAQRWLQIGLAINISGRELSDSHLVERVARQISIANDPPSKFPDARIHRNRGNGRPRPCKHSPE